MDPTKPILDLYGDSYYNNREREPKPQNYKTSYVSGYNDNSRVRSNAGTYQPRKTSELSYSELESKYQDLHHAYKDKSARLALLEEDSEQLKGENSRLRDELARLSGKNEELNAALLAKNMELEEAYRRLQDEMSGRGGSRVRGNEAAIDKLEDGLREAITSNFQILRESALSELKEFLR